MIQIFSGIFFVVIQIFVAVALIIIRYHFRIFSLPGDVRARLIVNIFTLGTLIAMVGGALAFISTV